MQFNTWGIGRRTEIASEYNAERYLFIDKVLTHLNLTLIEIKGGGQPVQISLGEQINPNDIEAVQARVTPFFSSFEALDYFCQINLQRYLACDPSGGLPSHWFWEESRGASERTPRIVRRIPENGSSLPSG